ncbi:MAG: selenoneine biosynthesis selenosugar synthase SenB [Planctomycetaceae bacterium]
MRLLIVTPAARHSRRGNRVTAVRWAGLLRQLGHRVEVAESFAGQRADVLIALHARKSAKSVRDFRAVSRDAPILLTLTGTDLYAGLQRSKAALNSLRLADRLIVLQADAVNHLPKLQRGKACVIVQSCESPRTRPAPLTSAFEVCVSGHLRAVKDPFRTEMASRLLPSDSRIRVTHLGAAMTETMRRSAEARMRTNPRYRWLGEQPRWKARRMLARSRLVVLSSKLEGGANVVSEAVAAEVPLLVSEVSGNIGLLGDDYAGCFPVGDTAALSRLLLRAETDSRYYRKLTSQIRRLRPMVRPDRERAAWADLLSEL